MALKLASDGKQPFTYSRLAIELGISASEARAAVKRATTAGLLDSEHNVRRAALLEFLVHGVK